MRIVIVEDEIKIREGMGKLIESQTNHIVVGEAANGEEGLEMILRFKPDLVITDIRMPKMDGLEMIRELNYRKFPVHTVILSGYSEFEYAKKAIQYGVEDYLLKPLGVEDIEKMLKTIDERIKEEQLKKGNAEFYLRNLVLGTDAEAQKNLVAVKSVCGLSENSNYEMFEAYIGGTDASYRNEMETYVEELKEKYPELHIHFTYVESVQKIYLLISEDGYEDRINAFERSLYNRMILRYQNKEDKAIWTKKKFTNISELKQIATKLDGIIAYALVLKTEGWLEETQVNEYKFVELKSPSEIYNKIRNAICQGNPEKLRKAMDEFIEFMESDYYDITDIRRAFLKSYYMIGDTLQDIDQKMYELLKNSNVSQNIESAVTWNEMKRAYGDIFQMIAGSKSKREDISNYVIKKAINYIREHYQEGITLEEVSRELEITPEYLSTLFNREVGINFTTFLKQFRMSHAKRLLKGTNMKIYEIAKATGYSDPKYFQRVFKETIGVSPGEYRQMH